MLNKYIVLENDKWVIGREGVFECKSSKECLKFNNTTNEIVELNYNDEITVTDKNVKQLRITFDSQHSNVGAYLNINSSINIPVNAEALMDVVPPTPLNIKLRVAALSSVEIKSIRIECLEEKDSLANKLSEDSDVLVIVPAYPALDNLYSCAFVHSRNVEYAKKGLKVQVASISQGYWFEALYDHQGISVYKGSHQKLKELLSKKQYKVIVTHFVDENLYSIFDGYIDNEKMIFICHGPETVFRYLENVTRPYFTPEILSSSYEKAYQLKESFVKKYSQKDNVEWVFVSEWLKEFSEEQLNIEFKNVRVINNIINEELFPYSPKKKEDRCKILIIRKFDNIIQHSIDQIVMAINILSKKSFFDELSFEIYGDGNYYDVLVQPLKKYKNIHFHRTFIPNNEIARVHAEAGILLIPSRHDAHAVAMGEGASSGLVVVGSRVTSNPFFMNENKYHTLADAEDPIELAGIIERLYNNPEEFLAISKGLSKETRENYCVENTVKKEIDLISEKLKQYNTEVKLDKVKSQTPTLTIAIPSYNVEKYIKKCINSILQADNVGDIEVLVINDGSKDRTSEIAHYYEKATNGIVKVIDQINSGHGGAINTAIANATGKYFRLVDGDDWVNAENLTKLVEIMKSTETDIILTKGSYEYVESALFEDIISYDNLAEGVVYNFDDLVYKGYGFKTYGPLLTTGNYRTELLKKTDMKISEKKPYVDMEFNSFSLENVSTLEYHNLDIYRYLIGREGQTISRDYWSKKYKDHEYVIENILKKISGSTKYSAEKKLYIMNNIIAQMVDSQIFMFDYLCRWEEIEPFMEMLKRYDVYEYCVRFIREKAGNCDLILNTYKLCLSNKNNRSPIVIPGVRETVKDLENAPLEFSSVKRNIKRMIRAVLPYGLVRIIQKNR